MKQRTRRVLTLAIVIAATPLLPGVASGSSPVSSEAVIIDRTVVRVAPNPHARKVASLTGATRLVNSDMVLPVVGSTTVDGQPAWLQVRLPDRPNGATGWIPAASAELKPLVWQLHVSLANRRLTVYRNGQEVRTFRVVIGARSTPTPTGEYFVVEHLRLNDRWAHGAWALATSAYSNVLRHFDGGNGQVALHGRGLLPEPLGSAGSHGCVRLADGAAAWLAGRIPNGTPLSITQ
ncbi:MAG: hypothetical protein NVSMB25_26220 [Thermoleophilaceae bacterium]